MNNRFRKNDYSFFFYIILIPKKVMFLPLKPIVFRCLSMVILIAKVIDLYKGCKISLVSI